MKKEKRLPTMFGIFILIFGVATGVFLIKTSKVWITRANPEVTPKQLKITNITEKSFAVSWVTDGQVAGFIQYGTKKEELFFNANDDRDQLSGSQGKFFVHHITVRDLKSDTNYFFKINSGGKIFDNNGQLYQVKTAPLIQGPAPESDIVYGVVLKQDGSPAEGVVVYLSLANAFPLSALTKSSGSWAIPLNLARSTDLLSWAVYDKEASVEEIFVQGGPLGVATAIGVTKNDSPLPSITLGQNFDFRQAFVSPTPTPTLQEPSMSGFSVGSNSSPTQVLQIINPSQGENVSTSTPEIFGTGPGGETLTIIVESPQTIQGKTIISSDGSWQWTPPTNLSPGQHTVTVSLPNGQRISRSFTVLAAESENSPSFTASPSATLTPTPTPTSVITPTVEVTPTSTSSVRSSLPSTEGGIPRPGNLTPTFLFFILGITLIFLGLLINNFYLKRV